MGLVMERLKTRPDFLRAAKGARRVAQSVTVELCPTPEAQARPGVLRVGFTATRKVGGAVERNRAKRRLRAAAAALLPLYGRDGNDYVLVARQDTLTRPFGGLIDDLTQALHAAHSKLGRLTMGKPR
jgi:ribonuclease P protein component